MQVDALPIDGPIYELFPYGTHPTFDLGIELDEWVARELSALVDELVLALPGAGVGRVGHEDGQVILVASGSVSRRQLAAWLDGWWRERLAPVRLASTA